MPIPAITCAGLIRDLRRQHPAETSLFLRFGQCRVGVQVNREEMAAALRDYFDPFLASAGSVDIVISAHEAPPPELPVRFAVKTPDPGKSKIKEAYYDAPDGRIVHKRLTGMLFAFDGDANLAIGPCMDNLNQVINFINNRYIEWLLCRGCLLGHAAGVMLGGRGVALAGFSGAGKSTLALHLMNRDAVFVSNDRLMVRLEGDGVAMHGVAKMPRINPGTALNNPALRQIMAPAEQARFAAMDPEALWELEHKYDAPIIQCYGPGRFVLHAPMQALVLLNWRRGGGPLRVAGSEPRPHRELLPAFLKPVGLFFLPRGTCRMPAPTEQAYAALLAHCAVYEFSGGADFDAAAEACVNLAAL